MASTINLYFRLTGVMNSELIDWPSGGLFAPYALTTSADIKLIEEVDVSTSSVTELISIGSGSDTASSLALIFIPNGACRIAWQTSTAADNSAIVCRANFPLVLPTAQTLPYQNTLSNRLDETAGNITAVSCWQNTGSTIKVKVLSVG